MTITKKHLKELADIVYDAQQKAETCTGPGDQDLEAVASQIKSFAQRHAPNFERVQVERLHAQEEEGR
jgi:SRSO17 transposase